MRNSRGYEMIADLAKYWESRVVFNSATGLYDIHGKSDLQCCFVHSTKWGENSALCQHLKLAVHPLKKKQPDTDSQEC